MKFFRYAIFFCIALASLTQPCFADEAYRSENLVLLQIDSVLKARLGSVDALVDYIKKIEQQISEDLGTVSAPNPSGGFIVIGIRPENKSHVWLDFESEPITAIQQKIISAVKLIKPPSVKGGIVLFALNVSLWGGKISHKDIPSPKAWLETAKKFKETKEISEIADLSWTEVK